MIASYILVAFLAFIVGAVIGGCYFDTFKIGAEWMQKKMIEKACEWVEKHIFDFPWYDNEQGDFSSKDVANALRKAMKE